MMPQSPSSINCFLQCPFKYYGTYISKEVSFISSPSLDMGNKCHETMSMYIDFLDIRQPEIVKKIKENLSSLPLPLRNNMINTMKSLKNIKNKGSEIYAERSLATRRDLTSCGWFDPDAYLRSRLDAIIINDVSHIIDWKSGKVNSDLLQLEINTINLYVEFGVEECFCIYSFLSHGIENMYKINVHSAMDRVFHKIDIIEKAYKDDVWEAKKSPLCKYCNYKKCKYRGV